MTVIATTKSPSRICPFCRSGQVSTTDKSKGDDERSYWRCGTCGQIWNPSRLRVVNRRP